MKRNAVILAAGLSSRFIPARGRHPKGLTRVKGEILIERQIRQLREAGVEEIIVVTGYQREQFAYLKEQFGVILVHNPSYASRNNHSSIYAARSFLDCTYICSCDNYFPDTPFLPHQDSSYYAAVYAEGPTREWCLTTDESGRIIGVSIGGEHSWYMLGHAYWNRDFSRRFLDILEKEYLDPSTVSALWETIYVRHMEELPLYIRKYPPGAILEFDTVEELKAFDPDYDKG